MTRTATNKGLKYATNKVLKEMVGKEATNRYGDKWEDVVSKLVPSPLASGDGNGKKKKRK